VIGKYSFVLDRISLTTVLSIPTVNIMSELHNRSIFTKCLFFVCVGGGWVVVAKNDGGVKCGKAGGK
jgi:hypothetical protein